jgi:hypothetical protein
MPIKMRDRIRYRFIDQALTRPGRLMLILAGACLLLVAVITGVGLLIAPAEPEPDASVLERAWHALTLALDPGTIGEEQGSAVFRLLMLVVTLGGILIISSLIGVLSAALNNKLETLRRGRNRVVSSGSTVVLGWSDEIHTILSELILANDRSVVILASDLTKQEMEEAVRGRHGDEIRAICRFGDPTLTDDLELAPLDTAGAIIVPRPFGKDPDIRVLMTLLALNHREWPTGSRPPVAAVISAQANVRAARLALGGWPAHLANVVEAEDVSARLLVQSRRYPGLSVACSELLSFAGNEIRLPEPGNRVGRFRQPTTYGEALLAFESAALIGVRRIDGTLDINPPGETPIATSDTPIVIARGSGPSDIRLLPAGRRMVPELSAVRYHVAARLPRVENTLILGRNSRIGRVISVLDGYVAAGSTLDLVASEYDPAEEFRTRNLSVTIYPLDPTDPGVLVPAEVGGPVEFDPTKHYHYVIVLADDQSETHSDARALVTLLHLREIKDRTGADFKIICELNDDANRRLARNLQADDLVVGQRVVSSAVVQYAKNPGRRELTEIVDELFDARGGDMYFEPADDYVAPGVPVTFATVVEAASRRQETAIGYRVAADRLLDERNYGVHLNPPKSHRRVYQAGDQVIVIAHRHFLGAERRQVFADRRKDEPDAVALVDGR